MGNVDLAVPSDLAERDQKIGRRAAWGVLATVAAALVAGPLMTSANLIIVLAIGAEPNVEQAPGVTTFERWQGILPIDVPWWVYLAISLAMGVILAAVWRPSRHYLGMWRRKVVLIAMPGLLAWLAVWWAAQCLGFGGYYTSRDEWQGFLFIPVAVAVAVAVAGFVQRSRTRPKLPKRRRKKRIAPSEPGRTGAT